jgi:hypothetical protein
MVDRKKSETNDNVIIVDYNGNCFHLKFSLPCYTPPVQIDVTVQQKK